MIRFTRGYTVLFLVLVGCILGAMPVSAGGRVRLAHESFVLPDYISSVDVSPNKYAEFDCNNGDACAIYVGFYPRMGGYTDQTYTTEDIVADFVNELTPRYTTINGGGYGSNVVTSYRTATGISGKRERVLLYDNFINDGFVADFFFHYSPNGDVRMILYIRPGSYLSAAQGNGYPVFSNLLDSLVLID